MPFDEFNAYSTIPKKWTYIEGLSTLFLVYFEIVWSCSIIVTTISNADGCWEGWGEGVQMLTAKCREEISIHCYSVSAGNFLEDFYIIKKEKNKKN